jgi:hypothetical protein
LSAERRELALALSAPVNAPREHGLAGSHFHEQSRASGRHSLEGNKPKLAAYKIESVDLMPVRRGFNLYS